MECLQLMEQSQAPITQPRPILHLTSQNGSRTGRPQKLGEDVTGVMPGLRDYRTNYSGPAVLFFLKPFQTQRLKVSKSQSLKISTVSSNQFLIKGTPPLPGPSRHYTLTPHALLILGRPSSHRCHRGCQLLKKRKRLDSTRRAFTAFVGLKILKILVNLHGYLLAQSARQRWIIQRTQRIQRMS